MCIRWTRRSKCAEPLRLELHICNNASNPSTCQSTGMMESAFVTSTCKCVCSPIPLSSALNEASHQSVTETKQALKHKNKLMSRTTAVYIFTFPKSFGRLVLNCIDADFGGSTPVGKHLTRSTRLAFVCTSPSLKRTRQVLSKRLVIFSTFSATV